MKTPIRNSLRRLMISLGVFLFSVPTVADEIETGTLFPNSAKFLSSSNFTWGAEIGTSIDLSGYDTSTMNVDLFFGYKNKSIDIIGLGAGVHRSVGVGDNFVPVYCVLHTDFSKKRKPLFMATKVGYSFNTMGNSPTFGDTTASLGCGINLAVSNRFKSFLILAYEFRHFNKRHRDSYDIHAEDISLATLTVGISF